MADERPDEVPAPAERERPGGLVLLVFVYALAVFFILGAILAFAGAIKGVDTSPRAVLIVEGVGLLLCAGLMIGGVRVMRRRRREGRPPTGDR